MPTNSFHTVEVIKTSLSDVVLFDKRKKTTFVIPLAELEHVINALIQIENGAIATTTDVVRERDK